MTSSASSIRTRSVIAVRVVVFFTLGVAIGRPETLSPTRTLSLQPTVTTIRNTVAGVALQEGKMHLLVMDGRPSGRSAILVEAGTAGGNPTWRDLERGANLLVRNGGSVTALARVPSGLQVVGEGGGTAEEIPGDTVLVVGVESRLVRLLSNGDVAVHDAEGSGFGAPRILPTAAKLKVSSECPTCGAAAMRVSPGSYVLSPIGSGRVAFVGRSSASFHVLDLESGQMTVSTTLAHVDLSHGLAKFSNRPQPPPDSRPLNPMLVIAGDAHESGDTFLLIGPFTPTEGARVIQVDPDGRVVGSFRCTYPGFKPEDGPPRFLGVAGDELYLITPRGHVNVYALNLGSHAD